MTVGGAGFVNVDITSMFVVPVSILILLLVAFYRRGCLRLSLRSGLSVAAGVGDVGVGVGSGGDVAGAVWCG